jgi:hypothetical protein
MSGVMCGVISGVMSGAPHERSNATPLSHDGSDSVRVSRCADDRERPACSVFARSPLPWPTRPRRLLRCDESPRRELPPERSQPALPTAIRRAHHPSMSGFAHSLSSSRTPLIVAVLLGSVMTAATAQPNSPPAAAGGATASEDRVTIYRCTDAQGRLSLRDSPCSAGQRQETRSMQRPKDAPPRPSVAAPQPMVAAAAPAQQAPVVLVVQPPQPLYECVTPEGKRYLSDTAEGNPRLVPYGTSGTPMWTYVAAVAPPGQHTPPRPRPVIGYSAAMIWVRDACNALPQREVCDRLHDRRDELRRRFFNAQPSERAVLDREDRSLGARLANDCR